MKTWKRWGVWSYLIVLHIVLVGVAAAWLTGTIGWALDTHHLEIRTTGTEDLARALGGEATRRDRAHVVSAQGRKFLVIKESEEEGLDEMEVAPPGSKVVWAFSRIPVELSKLQSEWTIGIRGMSSDTPLGPERGKLEWIMVDTNADGMPDGKKEAGPDGMQWRLRRDAWVPKDHPDAMSDPR